MKGFSIKTHSIESRCVIGSENILFAGSSCIFQPGHFTGWGSEGVNRSNLQPIAVVSALAEHWPRDLWSVGQVRDAVLSFIAVVDLSGTVAALSELTRGAKRSVSVLTGCTCQTWRVPRNGALCHKVCQVFRRGMSGVTRRNGMVMSVNAL